MLLRAGFTLLWNPFPHQPIIQNNTITQDITNDIIGEEEYDDLEDDCEEINTKSMTNTAESANTSSTSHAANMKKKLTFSSLTTHNTTTASSSNSSFTSETSPSHDITLDYLQGYLFKSPITSTLLDTPIPGYYNRNTNDNQKEGQNGAIFDEPLIYYKRREDYYPSKKQFLNVALEQKTSRGYPGIPNISHNGGMPVLKPINGLPKKALFKRLKTLVKKK